MKTKPRQHISNKYNTCTVVTSPVYIGSKVKMNIKYCLFYLRNEEKNTKFNQSRQNTYDIIYKNTHIWYILKLH